MTSNSFKEHSVSVCSMHGPVTDAGGGVTCKDEHELSSTHAHSSPSNKGNEIGSYNSSAVLQGTPGARREGQCYVE